MTDRPISRSILKAVTLAALSGVAAGLLLVILAAAGVGAPDPGPVHGGGWPNRSRGWLTTRGFHETQFSDADQRPYNWTGASMRLQIAELDRNRAYRMTFQLEAPQRPDVEPTRLSWAIFRWCA